MPEKIRIVIADDHALVRLGIIEYIESADDIIVLGEASNGNEAIALTAQYKPDVLLLDINMPDMTGIKVTQYLRETQSDVKILILTAYDEDPYVFSLLQAGANGYLLKNCDIDELLGGIRSVYVGKTILSPAVADKIVNQIRHNSPIPQTILDNGEELTSRELEILRLAARGLTNKAIGRQIGISDRTAQGHLANIYAKLEVASRTEAVTEAMKRGLITFN